MFQRKDLGDAIKNANYLLLKLPKCEQMKFIILALKFVIYDFFIKYCLPFNWVLIDWIFVRRTSWSFSYPNKLMKWVVFLWLWNAKIKLPDLLLLNYLKLKCFYFFFFFDWCFSGVTFKLLKRNLRLKLISRKTFCLK